VGLLEVANGHCGARAEDPIGRSGVDAVHLQPPLHPPHVVAGVALLQVLSSVEAGDDAAVRPRPLGGGKDVDAIGAAAGLERLTVTERDGDMVVARALVDAEEQGAAGLPGRPDADQRACPPAGVPLVLGPVGKGDAAAGCRPLHQFRAVEGAGVGVVEGGLGTEDLGVAALRHRDGDEVLEGRHDRYLSMRGDASVPLGVAMPGADTSR